MTYIKLGGVRAFPGAVPDKAQALKVLEEAAEVFGAWQEYEHGTEEQRSSESTTYFIVNEIADTITACCNLAAALGVDDLAPYLARCEECNRERGRYDSGDR